VYSQADPARQPDVLQELANAQAKLQRLEQEATVSTASPAPNTSKAASAGRFLGPETIGLRVTSTVNMRPVPTGIYHLLDPDTDPLVTVDVENVGRESKTRRVCVKAYLEGLSAEAVRTVELKRHEPPTTLKLLPTLLRERVRDLSEVHRSTLHVIVTDLDNKPECHDTHSVTCLARTSSFNSVHRPGSGEPVDLTDYYGAWVTPHAEPVQQLLRRAADHCGGAVAGYQVDADSVERQVAALYQALKEAGITYVNSLIDYGAAPGMRTQRTRLPREALGVRSANCIDGTVLFASLLEAATLNAVLVFVPGHAFVGWQTGDLDDSPWSYLETTMIGGYDFAEACRSGQKQYDEARKFNVKRLKECRLPQLRERGIWPME
jgi:hypothetical protein